MKPSQSGDRSRGEVVLLLLVIVAIAATVRIVGIPFGLPFAYHFDEHYILRPAARIIEQGILDPGWYKYPDLYIYAQSLMVWTERLLAGPPALEASGHPPWTYLLGRGLTTLLGTGTVLLVFAAARTLWNPVAGLAAGMTIAVTFFHVQHSQFITTDVPAGFMVSVGLWLACRGWTSDRGGWFLASAAAMGLAAAAKYNAGAALLIPASLWLASRRRSDRTVPRGLLFGTFAFLLAFVVAMPWVLLKPGSVLQHVLWEARHYTGGHPGFEDANNWVESLVYLFERGFGPELALLVGAGWMASFTGDRRLAVGLSVFPAAYVLALGALPVRMERNLLPVVPILGLFAGYGLHRLHAWVRPRLSRPLQRFFQFTLVLGLFGAPLVRIAHYDREILQTDTRTTARGWMTANLPAESHICTEMYRPPVDRSLHRHSPFRALCEVGLAGLRRRGCDYVVASSMLYQRYLDQPEAYPVMAACYRRLFARWPLLGEFSGRQIEHYHDPTLRIHAVPQ